MNRKFVRHAIQGASWEEQEKILEGFQALRLAAQKAAGENGNEDYQWELMKLATEARNLSMCLVTCED